MRIWSWLSIRVHLPLLRRKWGSSYKRHKPVYGHFFSVLKSDQTDVQSRKTRWMTSSVKLVRQGHQGWFVKQNGTQKMGRITNVYLFLSFSFLPISATPKKKKHNYLTWRWQRIPQMDVKIINTGITLIGAATGAVVLNKLQTRWGERAQVYNILYHPCHQI